MAKLNLDRIEMPRQDPKKRAGNFNEVALGYDAEMAREEASRCIKCKKRPCVDGCPVNIDIPEFIQAINEGDMPAAVKIIKKDNSLPGVCGRVCPQEIQCEEQCILNKKRAPVAIGRLERYIADWERANKDKLGKASPPVKRKNGRVAVIGAGPAGLTAASDLAMIGYQVTIFEALHAAGGVLVYGIPEFRLPKDIVKAEVDYVVSLGVEIIYDIVIGKTITIDELLESGYDAVFIGSGAGLPVFMGVPGENLNGVYSANEFLTRINLMKAYAFPEYDTPVTEGKKIAVIGGGNVAMDAARCALRLGADEVNIIYRRSKIEMPARHEEAENAAEEGVKFRILSGMVAIIGDEQDWVQAVKCVRMELGEPDAGGRRRPIPVAGSEFLIEADTVIVALGTTPNPLVPETTKGLEINKKQIVITDKETGKTSKKFVWAGGDVSTGSATIISAMGAARIAAKSIDSYLKEIGKEV
jgi:glutamate synthase (NADPH/NADH) small chain